MICHQEEKDERGGLMCDWQVNPFVGGIRHAVTVPASCGCSSDARRSVGQSSSCSFVCGCCRDTKTVKKGRKEEERQH